MKAFICTLFWGVCAALSVQDPAQDTSTFVGVRVTKDNAILGLGKKQEIQLFRDANGILQIRAPKGVNIEAPSVRVNGKPLGSGGSGGSGGVDADQIKAAVAKALADMGLSNNVAGFKGLVCKQGWTGDGCKQQADSGKKEQCVGEGQTLKIKCDKGVVRVLDASYGKNPKHGKHCPHKGVGNGKCHAGKSMEKVKEKCEGKSACTVGALNSQFGDPCGGVGKYLSVEYVCKPQQAGPPSKCDAQKGPQKGNCPMAKCMAPRKGCKMKKEFKKVGNNCCPKPCNYVEADGKTPCGADSGKQEQCVGEGKTMSIKCAKGVISVSDASYGKNPKHGKHCPHKGVGNGKCHSGKTMEKVKQKCEGKSSCSVGALNSLFGDPCGGVGKYLSVEYVCKPQQAAKEQCVGEGGTMSIKCATGRVRVLDASYGKNPRHGKHCPHKGVGNGSCHAGNSLQKVKQKCEGRSSCSVAGSNGHFGDPCGGVGKYLTVKYKCA